MRLLWLVPLLLLSACTRDVAEPRANARDANQPASNKPASSGGPEFAAWPDDFKLASHVELPALAAFWQKSAFAPATPDTKEPVLVVSIDKDGLFSSRRAGEDWKPHPRDSSLLELLRRFAEESFDPDAMLSYCQVVLGADKRAPMIALLGVQEMMAQARCPILYLATLNARNEPYLLDLSATSGRPRSVALLTLEREGEGFSAKLVLNDETQNARGLGWAGELEKLAAKAGKAPEVLQVSARGMPLSTVAEALNALAALGMSRVRLVP